MHRQYTYEHCIIIVFTGLANNLKHVSGELLLVGRCYCKALVYEASYIML